VTEPERDIEVPVDVRAGVWANDVDVFGDSDEMTLDFIRLDPGEMHRGLLVSRVTLSHWCILKLRNDLERIS
jgi:hypothetical protein